MKQEYWLILIVGLLLVAYVLEAITPALSLDLATPYHYIQTQTLRTYPFTTTLIITRAVALVAIPILLLSFIERKYQLKAVISLVLAGLTQLYVLQDLALGSVVLPLEWALAIALAGIAMLPMVVIYFLKSLAGAAHQKLVADKTEQAPKPEEKNEEESEE